MNIANIVNELVGQIQLRQSGFNSNDDVKSRTGVLRHVFIISFHVQYRISS